MLADDHAELLSSLAELLEAEGYTIVGRARSGRETIQLLATHRPDLAVIDQRLGDMTGIEVVREATRLGTTAAFVIHTAEVAPPLGEAIEAGVCGIAYKSVPPTSLLLAMAAAAAGTAYIDPAFVDSRR